MRLVVGEMVSYPQSTVLEAGGLFGTSTGPNCSKFRIKYQHLVDRGGDPSISKLPAFVLEEAARLGLKPCIECLQWPFCRAEKDLDNFKQRDKGDEENESHRKHISELKSKVQEAEARIEQERTNCGKEKERADEVQQELDDLKLLNCGDEEIETLRAENVRLRGFVSEIMMKGGEVMAKQELGSFKQENIGEVSGEIIEIQERQALVKQENQIAEDEQED